MDHVKRMRAEQSDAEARVWTRLRNRQLGMKFRRQHRAEGFILDFACVERMLAVELDGGQHVERADHDAHRTRVLERAGWRVLRFWNDDALSRTDAVMDAIWHALHDTPPHPNPLPRRRGRGGDNDCNNRSQDLSPSPSPSPSGRIDVGRVTTATRHPAARPDPAVSGPSQHTAPSPPRARERAGVRGALDPAVHAPHAALHLRARLNRLIREFLHARDVLEVETPVLARAGNTDPNIASFSLAFSGRTDGAPRTRWLRTSPEFALKRLLAAGIGDCYELGRVFRDGEAGGRHNPEFTLLEWYRVGWDHRQLAAEAIELAQAALALVGRTARPVTRSYHALFADSLGLDVERASDDALRHALGDVVIDPDGLTRDDWLDLLMTHRIQPSLPADQLLAVMDYPASQCALARVRAGDPPVAERFELYLGPLEIANGYHELTDAAEQGHRFDRDRAVRAARGHVVPPRDEALLAALAAGLPACAGVALGIDRLLMAMLDTPRIADVLAFDFAAS